MGSLFHYKWACPPSFQGEQVVRLLASPTEGALNRTGLLAPQCGEVTLLPWPMHKYNFHKGTMNQYYVNEWMNIRIPNLRINSIYSTHPFSSWFSIARTMARIAMAASGQRETRPEMVVAHWLAGTPNTNVQMVSRSSWRGKSCVFNYSITLYKVTFHYDFGKNICYSCNLSL